MCIYTERIRARLIAGADYSIHWDTPDVLSLEDERTLRAWWASATGMHAFGHGLLIDRARVVWGPLCKSIRMSVGLPGHIEGLSQAAARDAVCFLERLVPDLRVEGAEWAREPVGITMNGLVPGAPV